MRIFAQGTAARAFVDDFRRALGSDRRPLQSAAGLAFYGMFALAPIIFIGYLVAGMVFDQAPLAAFMSTRLPELLGPEAAQIVQASVVGMTQASASSGLLASIVSFGALLIAGSGLFFELQHAVNAVWDLPVSKDERVWVAIRRRLLSVALVFGAALLLVLATVADLFVTWFGSWWRALLGFGGSQFLLSEVATLGLMAICLALLYKALPEAPVGWRDVWPGALAGALLMRLAGLILGWYFTSTRITSAFQAAGATALLLIAINLLATIFLIGVMITRAYANTFGSRRHPPGV
jgi:membrane protein